MQLYYDNIVYWLQRAGGISTYWYELTRRFQRDEETELYFFEVRKPTDNIQRRQLHIDEDHILYNGQRKQLLVERFRRPDVPVGVARALFHSSYFRVPQRRARIKKVCTVHDFTHDLFFGGPRVWLHNYSKKRAILESDAIITVSENTKNDLFRFYPEIDRSKVITIYNGVSEEFRDLGIPFPAQERPYILFIGARDSYKNFHYAVDVASGLPGYDLKIVGNPLTDKEAAVVKAKLGSRFQVLTGLSGAELNRIYNEAHCLLYPSSYEGFGIPLAEAMKAGCPFIAVNNSSIPEVAGDAGILLAETSLEEGMEAVKRIAGNREVFRKKGFEQAGKFSWDLCYEQTKRLYNQLL